MKVLIVDDSEYKIEGLKSLLWESGLKGEISVARAFHTAMRLLEKGRPDLVLLDMSLPTFDGDADGRSRLFGGRELLAEMEFLELHTKVIVVTQFDRFGESPNSVELTALLSQLKQRFPPLFVGGVYWSNVDMHWREELKKMLAQCWYDRS